MNDVLVLGTSRPEGPYGNIGDAVVEEFVRHYPNWKVRGTSCWNVDQYTAPPVGELERYDALVVSLGRAHIEYLAVMEEADLADVIRANLTLPLLAAKRYVQARGQFGGAVVFIGSYAHDHVLSRSAPYCAAKAGLAHAVRCLAWDLGELYRFNIVHPYHVEGTPMERYVLEAICKDKDMNSIAEAREYQRKDLRSEQALTAIDVAGVVARLIDDDMTFRWANGAGIELYGGVR